MFDFNYIELLKNFPPQLATMIIAMIPIAELRVALPLALTVYKLPLWQAFFYAFIGNVIPVFFIIYFIDAVSKFLMSRFKFFNRFFSWLFNRTRLKFEGKYAKYGLVALAVFVAIPLPVTGAWTGSVAAFLFQIPKKQAVFWICLGVMIAGIIVTIISLGAINTFNYLK